MVSNLINNDVHDNIINYILIYLKDFEFMILIILVIAIDGTFLQIESYDGLPKTVSIINNF